MSKPALVASRIPAALSHRTWIINGPTDGGPARCHLFLLLSGRATLALHRAPELEALAPALVWLPETAGGMVRILAGGEGLTASLGSDFVQRAAADPALAVHLRPLLGQVILAGPDMLQPQRSAVAGSFGALVEESGGLRPAAAAMCSLHLATLLLLLWRCTGLPAGAGRGAAASTAQRFRQLVELHYREGLRIDDFAARLGVTRAHLHDACLRATGRTPLALLHDRLLTEACTRLEHTDLTVEQVGYGIGFRDPGYFSRFFKRLTGIPPGAHRRRTAAASAKDPAPSFAAWP